MTLMALEVDNITTTLVGGKTCANPSCEALFDPTRHNQKYCSKQCCKLVTNAKIMQQYYDKKDRKAGKKRICKKCNLTTLSRYNEGNICQPCVLAERADNRVQLLQMVGAA